MKTPIRRTADSRWAQDRSTLNMALVRRRLFIRLLLAALTCCAGVHRADAGPGTVLVNENFEDGKIDGFTEVTPPSSKNHILNGASDGMGNRCYEIIYVHDEDSAGLSRYPLTFDSIEVSYSQRLPDGIPVFKAGRGFVGLKQSRLFFAEGANNRQMQHQIDYLRPGYNGPGSPELWQHNFFIEYGDHVFHVDFAFRPEAWQRVRYWMKLNSPGQRNGLFKLWLDGQLKVDATGLAYYDTPENRPDGVWVGGNFSHGGIDPDFPCRRWIDDVRIVINGDAPSTNQLTIAPIAKQTIKEDGATVAIPIKVSRGGSVLGNVTLTATSSNTAIVPASGLTVTGSGANWTVKAKPAANKHGMTTIRVQADDGAGVAATAFDVVIQAVADTPSITVASTTKNMPTTCGLVVSRNRADGAEVTHFKITCINHGSLYLTDGRTLVINGSFLTFAQANAGLRFKPALGFVGTATFDLQASTTATDAGLGGSVVKGQILVNAQ